MLNIPFNATIAEEKAHREECFRHMERALCRHERNRLIRLKRIIPSHRMPATLLVKNDAGHWVQELNR